MQSRGNSFKRRSLKIARFINIWIFQDVFSFSVNFHLKLKLCIFFPTHEWRWTAFRNHKRPRNETLRGNIFAVASVSQRRNNCIRITNLQNVETIETWLGVECRFHQSPSAVSVNEKSKSLDFALLISLSPAPACATQEKLQSQTKWQCVNIFSTAFANKLLVFSLCTTWHFTFSSTRSDL